ncbi:MAG TPA: hypothetical protein EYP04_00650, partial [Anaerolineae bacterium]|nr:hypothetical protein [Anaerolineae bacterium]
MPDDEDWYKFETPQVNGTLTVRIDLRDRDADGSLGQDERVGIELYDPADLRAPLAVGSVQNMFSVMIEQFAFEPQKTYLLRVLGGPGHNEYDLELFVEDSLEQVVTPAQLYASTTDGQWLLTVDQTSGSASTVGQTTLAGAQVNLTAIDFAPDTFELYAIRVTDADGDVLVDLLGVDHPAVGEHDLLLA